MREYTIAVYALETSLSEPLDNDDIAVDWETLTAAMAGHVIECAQL